MASPVTIKRLVLKNPFIASSGTAGYGDIPEIPLQLFGAVVTKTVTLQPREGNPPPRLAETPAGLINSIGLQNMGLEAFQAFLEHYAKPTTTIVSIGGENPDEFRVLIRTLHPFEVIDAFELNLSCPNLKTGGEVVGKDFAAISSILEAVLCETDKPVLVKLSPFTEQLAGILHQWEASVEAFVLFNTFPAMDIDVKTGRPVLGAVSGGLSGPAVYPIVLNSVYKYRGYTIIASGGIVSPTIAQKFLLAGAKAVQIGTGNLWNPELIYQLLEEVKW